MAQGSNTKRPFYGWRLAVVAGLVYFCSGDAVLPTATIVNPLMLADPAMSMNATVLGLGFSFFVLMQGIPGPLIGQLIARKGARFTMVVGGSCMIAAALAMIFVVRSSLAYLIVFGVLLSVSSVMAGLLSVQSTVGNWFVAKRGRAMTLTMTIAGLGAIIVPFVASRLVVLFDGAWQSGWYLVVFMGVVLVPLALLFIKNTPAEIGQQPDGAPLGAQEAEEAGADKGAGAQRVYKNRGSVRFADAVRSAPFWLISLVGTGGFVAYTLAVSQGVIHFTSLGFEQGSIVNAVVSMGFASLLGRLVIGMQSDRIEPVRLMSVALFIAAAGILQAAFASHPAMVFIYYLTTGFGFGAVSTLLPTTIANYFGAGEFAKQLGTTMLITTLVASTLPVFSGFVFDTTGLCVVAFLVTAGIVVLCALCGFLVRFPQEKGGG